MASVDTSDITTAKIWRALNTPGGDVYAWRDRVMIICADRAYDKSPVNNVNNARHRAGIVGTFKRNWHTRRTSNQHGVGAVIWNSSRHAVYVEEGRSASAKYQEFSWTRWQGRIRYIHGPGPISKMHIPFGGHKTAARKGKHILEKALAYAYRVTT